MNQLLAILFSLIGLAMLVFGSSSLFNGFASKSWKTSQGMINESRIVVKESSAKSRKNRSKKNRYAADIEYSYTVNGNYYTSNRIRFGMISYSTIFKSGEELAREWVGKYPKSSAVTVAYDPEEPSKSTLITGVHISTWILPMLGLVVLAGGLQLFRKSRIQCSGIALGR